jgi:hypothetical protein
MIQARITLLRLAPIGGRIPPFHSSTGSRTTRSSPAHRGNNFTKRTTQWQTLYYTSLSPQQLRANPPPGSRWTKSGCFNWANSCSPINALATRSVCETRTTIQVSRLMPPLAPPAVSGAGGEWNRSSRRRIRPRRPALHYLRQLRSLL